MLLESTMQARQVLEKGKHKLWWLETLTIYLELADLATKNTRCQVKLEFHKKMTNILVSCACFGIHLH